MKYDTFTHWFMVAVLLLVAGVQTAKAQKQSSMVEGKVKVVLHMAGNQKAEYDVSQLDSINFVEVESSGDNPSTDPSVTGDAIDITNKSATLVGYATSIRESLANDLRVGFIYCLEGTPNKNNGTQVTVNKNDVAEDGCYMATIENLLAGATYYFRSFVYQSGLWFYGKVKSFVTAGIEVNFTTGDATDITCFSAKVFGSVDVESSYSSLTYGICYGTSIEPTINDNTQTTSSNSFSLHLRQLTGGTIYYYRPYVIVDGQAYYGTVRTFRTLDDNVVETGTIDEETLIVTSHLTIGGGAYSSLVLGVCYGTTEIPTINNYIVTSDEVDEENNYTVQLINPGGSTIYYRAYVLIDGVPHYGKVKSNPNPNYGFDQWLYDNFVLPYNVEVNYFNADFNRSQFMACFIKYLFYDVYTKYAGHEFLKKYGPRIFQFIGSSGYNPATGTEVLSTASGGVKITLYNVNEIKPYSEGVSYSGEDIEELNKNYFHTIHHEFYHILHQTKSYPIAFGQITPGSYDPINWQNRDSVWIHQHGYVTNYASSATYEDFVETLSCIITDTDHRWMNRIINAAAMGVRQGDKEDILNLIDSLEINLDNPNGHWNNFTLYNELEYDNWTGDYESTGRYVLDEHRLLANPNTHQYQVVNKEGTAYVDQYKYNTFRKFTSFKNDFLPWVKFSSNENLTGINSLLKKLDIATNWYAEKWGLYAFTLRREVRERQNCINDFLQNEVIIFEPKDTTLPI